MYLGDPRERQICPDEHTIWEEDNRVEKRYQWGARILDLCDLDPKEYAQTIFNIRDVSSASPETKKDSIELTFTNSTANFTFPYPPSSDIYIVIKDSDGNKDVVVISKGQSSPFNAQLQNVDPFKLTTTNIGPSEQDATSTSFSDGAYDYSITSKKPTKPDYSMYVYMKHTMVEEGLTEEKVMEAGVQSATVSNKTAKFEYNIAPVAVSGFNDMNDDEYNEVIAREQLDLLIFTSSQISGIYINETDDQTSSWIRNYATITLNGVQYYVTRFVQNDLVNIYDPVDESPRTVIFTYKITMS